MHADIRAVRTHETPILAVALGQIRYRLALAVIGFGVWFGWLMACTIPLVIWGSYFDNGVAVSEQVQWLVTIGFILVVTGLTYRCRAWITRRALEEAPPEPLWTGNSNVRLPTGREIAAAIGAVLELIFRAAAVVAGLIIAAVAVYAGYLLLTMLSLPVAIVIGAIIVALAILIAASG